MFCSMNSILMLNYSRNLFICQGNCQTALLFNMQTASEKHIYWLKSHHRAACPDMGTPHHAPLSPPQRCFIVCLVSEIKKQQDTP